MSIVLAPPVVATPPGVEVLSPDGSLTAVVHAGFPGVLLRVRAAGRAATVWRTDGSEWVQVRSGAPCILSAGEGYAYDAEVAPGAGYVYALDRDVPASMVAVRLAGYTACEAWLKAPDEPGLSVRLARSIMTPWGAGDDLLLGAVTLAAGGVTGVVTGVSGLSGTMTLRTDGRQEWDRLSRALNHPGVLLLQASEAHAIDAEGGLYFTRGRRDPVLRETSRYGVRDTTIEWRQWDRPWPGEAPLRIPGWGWYQSTAGLTSAAEYAAAYSTTWQQLKAGLAGWSQ